MTGMSAYRAFIKNRTAKVAVGGALALTAAIVPTAMAATSGGQSADTASNVSARLPNGTLTSTAVSTGVATTLPQTSPATTAPASPSATPAKPSTTPTPETRSAPVTTAPVTPTATPKAVASPTNYVAVTMAQLMPNGYSGYQSSIHLTNTQMANARTIAKVAFDRSLPVRAAVIAVATSMQESKLENLHIAVDHDSVGLFQQRPSAGWGTVAECTDPVYATNQFLNHLVQIPNWQNIPLWQAAQTVQGSAYPYRYAQWELQAANIVQAISNS
jgi:hypothetical protein